jgi:imidazolonepropionase-like amidohydrolase
VATLYGGGAVFAPDGKLLERHGIMVEHGRIERIAPMAEFEGFAGEIVDTAGATVLPGLIDCHVHSLYGAEGDPANLLDRMPPAAATLRCLEQMQETLRGGITAIRDCGGKEFMEFAVRDACNSGRFQGPTMRAAGRIICMTGGHGNKFGRVSDGCDDVVKAVREQIHAGSDLIKLMATGGVMTPGVNPEDAHFTEDELRAGVEEGHRFHRHAASHAQGGEGIKNAVRAGVDSIEHGIFLDEEGLELMLENGTYLVPTLSAVINIIEAADKGIPAYAVEKAMRVSERHMTSIRMFYEAGGKIAMGTDAGTPFNKHGANAMELAYMCDLGVTPEDAIIFSSAHGADLMGIDDEGRLSEGNQADLLIVEGNPLTDIRRAADRANHRLVVKRGAAVPGSGNAQAQPQVQAAAASI